VDGDGDLDLAVGNAGDNNEVYLDLFDSGGADADGLPDIDLGDGGQGGQQPNIVAQLAVDPLNQTFIAGYKLYNLNEGGDFDIWWELTEAEQGSCTSTIDAGTDSIYGWNSTQQGQMEYLIDYPNAVWSPPATIDWYGEFCLQVMVQEYSVELAADSLHLNASTGQQTNGSSGADTDGDGVADANDLCPNTSAGTNVDVDGCPVGSGADPISILDVDFDERQEDNVWYQEFTVFIDDPWLGFNHSMSLKFNDDNGNTLYSYFSPMDDEDSQNGWWRLSTDMDEDPEEWTLDLNWEGIMEGGGWEGSSRFFDDTEYPYFEAGNYCVEISLGFQMNVSDTAMGAIKNLYDKEEFCFTIEHDSMAGVKWDGTEEEEKGLIDKLASNAIVGPLLDFIDSTTGQIVSVLLGVLAFAGRMVLARGQRAKNKRVRKFSNRIRNAETIGRLKIIEQDVEKANDKNRLPRGGFGDLMEQIETRMEKLGFDGQPEDGGTSGDWSSDDGQDEWQDDFQQAADMMWDAKDMMADAKEEAAMARQAIEDMQQQMGLDSRYDSAPEVEKKRYERSGLKLSDSAKSAGPSLPSAKYGQGGSGSDDNLISSILSKNIAPKDPCHCGSKKLYKDCHMKKDRARRERKR
jgi:hypothetical protein